MQNLAYFAFPDIYSYYKAHHFLVYAKKESG